VLDVEFETRRGDYFDVPTKYAQFRPFDALYYCIGWPTCSCGVSAGADLPLYSRARGTSCPNLTDRFPPRLPPHRRSVRTQFSPSVNRPIIEYVLCRNFQISISRVVTPSPKKKTKNIRFVRDGRWTLLY